MAVDEPASLARDCRSAFDLRLERAVVSSTGYRFLRLRPAYTLLSHTKCKQAAISLIVQQRSAGQVVSCDSFLPCINIERVVLITSIYT